ncbi:hypothetical protein Tco_0169368 [Tanacetum coccineum]
MVLVDFLSCGRGGGAGVDEVVGVVWIGSALLSFGGVEDDEDVVDSDENDELVFRGGDVRSVFIDSVFRGGESLDEFELFGVCCSSVCGMNGVEDIDVGGYNIVGIDGENGRGGSFRFLFDDVESIIEAVMGNSLVVVLKIAGKWYEENGKR